MQLDRDGVTILDCYFVRWLWHRPRHRQLHRGRQLEHADSKREYLDWDDDIPDRTGWHMRLYDVAAERLGGGRGDDDNRVCVHADQLQLDGCEQCAVGHRGVRGIRHWEWQCDAQRQREQYGHLT